VSSVRVASSRKPARIMLKTRIHLRIRVKPQFSYLFGIGVYPDPAWTTVKVLCVGAAVHIPSTGERCRGNL
jgi:hypothetical protein